MVRWVRTGRAKAGKMSQAVQWAKEIAEYINKKYGVTVSAFADVFGEIDTIRWYVDYANLDAIEKLRSELILDRDYLKKVSPVAELFIEGKLPRHSDARPLSSKDKRELTARGLPTIDAVYSWPPCRRSNAATSLYLLSSATRNGVRRAQPVAFAPAPLARSSSAIFL